MTAYTSKRCGAWIIAVSSAILAQGVSAQPAPPPAEASVTAHYPPGSIRSVEAADLALAEVGKERAEVERRFADEKNACFSRFFASSCEEDAKEWRRAALERLKTVEVEANAFKRRARVDERDRALEEKRMQDEKDRQERMRREEENPRQPRAAGQEQQSAVEAGQSAASATERQARHQAKLKRIEAEEAANAPKRAENIAAYRKKVQDAQARQREIEKRKAEKAQERMQQPSPAPGAQ